MEQAEREPSAVDPRFFERSMTPLIGTLRCAIIHRGLRETQRRAEEPWKGGRTMSKLRTFIAIVIALALPAGLTMPGIARAETVSIPSVTPASPWALLKHEAPAGKATGELSLPPQATGPVPALVLKHGSGGMVGPTGDNIRKWARMLNGWGIATFIVDSFGPRGIAETGTNQAQLSSWADTADALAALKLLGADPRIDRTRIGIIGWSRGGAAALQTALESVRKSVIADDLKFALHVAFYGPATTQYRDRATDRSPFLFLHGEADNYVPIGPTRELANWMQGMGSAVSFVGYPGAYHDFDVETAAPAPAKRGQGGSLRDYSTTVETFGKCDLVVDLTNGHVTRMDHKDDPTATPDSVRTYMRTCMGHGANLGLNAGARADSIEKVHAFLKQYFHIAG
jgi:dienelactone hydrolase